jgi:phytoene dehydrogenase-like protein
MTDDKMYDAIIVGGGIAGLTAASYLCKYGYHPLVIEKQEETGGLVHSFPYKGFIFDSGIRSIESSGIVKPLIRDLGLDIDYRKSQVTLGIKDQVITLSSKEDIKNYEALMISLFPNDEKDIKKIVKKIYQILGYMDVLYGIDNPMMMDLKKHKSYVIKTLLPWLFKFIPTLYHIDQLTIPVEGYLRRYTQNESLIDMMIQHFFKATPTFFALGYFGLYFDYHYPQGGTGKLTEALTNYILDHQGIIKTKTEIIFVDPEKKYIKDKDDVRYDYKNLIWSSDLKTLYQAIDISSINQKSLKKKVELKKSVIMDKRGAESVLTVYATVDLPLTYFGDIASEHFFYTPQTQGIHRVLLPKVDSMALLEPILSTYYQLQTYEISIPALRDSTMSPNGKTGLIISILMDYDTIKHIDDQGYYQEFKTYTEKAFIDILSSSIYPLLKEHVIDTFSATPLTFKKRNGSTDGAIIGWAYDSKPIPVHHKMSKITSSMKTPIPYIYQAGQWSFSPAGVPISVITGKLSADRVKKNLKKQKN